MHQIRYFLAVCDDKNFTRAAHHSFVSQPSLTQAIRRLEDEVGGELFSRGRSGAQLTALGKILEPRFRHIYESSLSAMQEAVRFQRLKKTPFRVGLLHSISSKRFQPSLCKLQKENPNLELEVIVESDKELKRRWQKNELDCVFCPKPPWEASANFQPLYKEGYLVALWRGHPLAKRKYLDLSDLQAEPYLDRLHCEMREQLKQFLKEARIELYAAFRSNREEWLLEMVEQNRGIAIVPEDCLSGMERVVGVALNKPSISREIGLLYKKKSEFKPLWKQLVTSIRSGGDTTPCE